MINRMTISQEGVNSFNKAFGDARDTYFSDLSTSINNFCETINNIWCSTDSQNFGKSFKGIINSINQKLVNTINKIENVANSNIQNYNSQEEVEVSRVTIYILGYTEYTEPLGSLNSSFSNGINGDEKGLAEGHTLEELSEPISAISQSVKTFMTNLSMAISSANIFDGSEQLQFAEEIKILVKIFYNNL